MPNFRGILTFAIPAVTVVFGFIWYFGRKKSPKPKLLEHNKTDPKTEFNSIASSGQREEVVEKEDNRNDVLASPATNRKRKAFQITRTDDDEVSDGPDSVDEEMAKGDKISPKLSHSVSSSAPKPSQIDVSGGKLPQGKTQKRESYQNGSLEQTELDLNTVNESMVQESASQSMLFGEKSSFMNDAFMTTGISEQSILGEKDKQCKVEDISLSTSLSEPLLESTMLDTTQSQPPTEVVEEVAKKESSVLETVPSVIKPSSESKSSKRSQSEPTPVSENVEKQSKDTVSSTMNGTTVEKSSVQDKKQENNSHTADKTETGKNKTAVDIKRSSSPSPKHTDKKAASSTKIENNHHESYRKSKQEVQQKTSPPKDRPINRTAHHSGGSDHALDNGVHGSDSNSSGCDNASEASNDSGRGPSMTELSTPNTSPHHQMYHCNFPTAICGRLIGKQGKNINFIKEKSGANITLSANPFTPEFQLCSIEGSQRQIEAALRHIGKKFPDVDLSPVNIPTGDNPQSAVLMPDIMQVMPGISQLSLPEGVSIDVVVSSIVDAGHIFIQQPTHPSYPSLERLNQFMIACYMQDGLVPQLPRPLEVGVICAAPMLNGWYRAQISAVCEESDECDIKYVDYGGFSRVQGSTLRQIRSDFMTLPFQACECYMANITPLQDEEYFSAEAAAILEDLTQGKMLQAQVVGRSEDGIPYVHIYQINGEKVTFVNRELVNRGATRWIEVLS